MRIGNIIGILGLAAMLFLVAIATGVAHADEGRHHPYYTSYDIQHIHAGWVDSVTIMYVSTNNRVTMYRWERGADCFTRIYPNASNCVKAHVIEKHHRGHVQSILVAVTESDGDVWWYRANSSTPSGYYLSINQEWR